MQSKKCRVKKVGQEMRIKKCRARNADQEMKSKKCRARNAEQKMQAISEEKGLCEVKESNEVKKKPKKKRRLIKLLGNGD